MEELLNAAAAKLQPQANATAQALVIEVDDEMRGRPVDEVYAELERRFTAVGFAPSPGLRDYAVAISEGTLER